MINLCKKNCSALLAIILKPRLDYQQLFGKGARAPPRNPRLDA